jgi:hypothetical protein
MSYHANYYDREPYHFEQISFEEMLGWVARESKLTGEKQSDLMSLICGNGMRNSFGNIVRRVGPDRFYIYLY